PEDIAPGTIVGSSAPAGWSHLVIKSFPRVRDDQREGLHSLTIEKASWMFTAFTADVVREDAGGKPRYRLRAIGLGLGTRRASDGQDVVITPATAAEYGVKLDFITKEILTRGSATQQKAVVVVHGPSFALLDTPVWLRWNGKNQLVRYRYGLLVDTTTGQLDTFLWTLGPDGGLAQNAEVVWLPPDLIDEVELVVDRDEIIPPGIPKIGSDGALAVDNLPKNRGVFPLPPALRGLAAQTRFTPDEAHALE